MLISVAGLSPRRLRVPALPEGGPLLHSDSPEYAPVPGLLYRDTVAGPVRVLYHHVNATGAPAVAAIGVRSAGPGPLLIQPAAEGSCAGFDYMGCGAAATTGFLQSAQSAQGTFGAWPVRGLLREDLLLQPGEWRIWPAGPLAPGELWAALFALDLSGFAEVATLMLPPAQLPRLQRLGQLPPDDLPPAGLPAVLQPDQLPLLPPVGPQIRGTVPAAERLLRLTYRVSLGPVGLQLANPPRGRPGTWAEPLPGEYLPAIDATTGRLNLPSGNYGVTYWIAARLINDTPGPVQVHLALNPRGGPYFGPLAVDGEIYLPPRPVQAGQEAWAPVSVHLSPGAAQDQTIRFIPAGASVLPVRLLWLPAAALPDDPPDSAATRGLA